MNPKSKAAIPAGWRILSLALASAGLSALFLRHGLLASEDSWAYWEGSVSILENHAYTYFGGEPVTGWPPGLSLYIALFQAIFGKTGVALIIATCSLNFLTAAIWLLFLENLFRTLNEPARGLQYWAAALFITLYIAVTCYTLEGHIIVLPALGLLFVLALRVTEQRWPANRWRIVTLSAAISVATFAHNSALTFVPAAIAVFWPTLTGLSLPRRGAIAAAFGALCAVPWIGSRALLHQAHSHGLGKVLYNPFQLAIQGFTNLGSLFLLPKPFVLLTVINFGIGLALLVWMFWLLARKGMEERKLQVPVILVLISGAGLYGILNFVYISGPLAARYLSYMPLALVGPLCLWANWRKSTLAMVGLCALLFTCKVWRLQFFARHSVVTQQLALPAYHGTLHPSYFLTSQTQNPPPPGFTAIVPPTFDWMQRWQTGSERESQKLVRVRSAGVDASSVSERTSLNVPQ